MKIKCPACLTSAKVDDSRIPDAGRKAACPKCGVALFIDKSGQARLADAPPPPGPVTDEPTPPADDTRNKPEPSTSLDEIRPTPVRRLIRGTGPSSQTASRSRQRSSGDHAVPDTADPNEFDPDFEPPVNYPDTRSGHGCLAFLMGAFVVVLSIVFMYSSRPPQEDMELNIIRQVPKPHEQGYDYPKNEFDQDLRMMRRKIITRNYTSYIVKLYGPEYRVVDDLLLDCGLNCPYIIQMKIIPFKEHTGFTAEIWCGDLPDEKVLKYWWTSGQKECP